MPSTDAELCGVVQRLYHSIRSVTPGRLQDALREVYPQAVVGRLEIPDEPMPMWLSTATVTTRRKPATSSHLGRLLPPLPLLVDPRRAERPVLG
jgi:hypothetical protein